MVYLLTSQQVLEQAEVWETIGCEGKGHRYRQYTLKLSFLPHHYYQVPTRQCQLKLTFISLSSV